MWPRLSVQPAGLEDRDWSEVQVQAKLTVTYQDGVNKEHALLNRIEAVTSEEERKELITRSGRLNYQATVLPIWTVGVQGDSRSYSFAVGVSCSQEPDWEDLVYFAYYPRHPRQASPTRYGPQDGLQD